MISLKKHLEGFEDFQALVSAYQSLVSAILALTQERLPTRNGAERRKFARKLADWDHALRKTSRVTEVEACGAELNALLESRWEAMAAYFAERERELTEIIALLSETASRLDHSNHDFYKNLHQSVHALEAIGRLDDLARVRRELSEHVKRLETTLNQQEARTKTAIESIHSNLGAAQKKVQVVGRLVSADPLKTLPARRHAEQFLAGLIHRERAFAVGVILIDRLESITRRYGDDFAEQVLVRFSTALRDKLPVKVHLYRWEHCSFVAFTDHVPTVEIKEALTAFLDLDSSRSFATGERAGRPAVIEPRYVVHEVRFPTDNSKVIRLIDQFCATGIG